MRPGNYHLENFNRTDTFTLIHGPNRGSASYLPVGR
jgi:hypothetical protein